MLVFQFIAQFYPGCKDILVSNPSWGNHKLMIDRIPGLNFVQYTYYNSQVSGLVGVTILLAQKLKYIVLALKLIISRIVLRTH